MNDIIYIDGVETKSEAPDFDKDGKTGGTEIIKDISFNPIQSEQKQNILMDVFNELFKDNVEKNTNMSSVDLRSRLNENEIANILVFDSLIGFDFLSKEDNLFLSRQKKRLMISKDGLSRSESVEVAKGERAYKKEHSTMDKIKNAFKFKDKEKGGD